MSRRHSPIVIRREPRGWDYGLCDPYQGRTPEQASANERCAVTAALLFVLCGLVLGVLGLLGVGR